MQYPDFQQHQLFFYFDSNPYIKNLKQVYLGALASNTLEDSRFNYTLDSTRKHPKFIYCGREFHSGYRRKLDIYNKNRELENKKPKKISIVYLDMTPTNNGFGVVYEDSQLDCFNDFENEYLLKNFKYPGLTLPQGFSIDVWGSNPQYINEQFGAKSSPTTIKAQKLVGITEDYYHLKYNDHYFWLLRQDCGCLFKKLFEGVEVDVEGLNQMCQWDEWKANNYRLQPHQIDGIKFLKAVKRGCIFDETGIGKTFQSICAAISEKSSKILVVTIANDKMKWRRNFDWYRISSTVLEGSETEKKYKAIKKWDEGQRNTKVEALVKKAKKDKKAIEKIQAEIGFFDHEGYDSLTLTVKNNDGVFQHTLKGTMETTNPLYLEDKTATIINYDLLPSLESNSTILNTDYDTIIVDECHRVKEANTKQSSIIRRLCNKPNVRVYGLSATPIENNENIFNVLRNLGIHIPGVIPYEGMNYTESAGLFTNFIKRYCAGWEMEKNGKRILIRGISKSGETIVNTNSHELSNIIKSRFIRRTAKDVEGFPEKKIFPLYVNMNAESMKAYDCIIEDVRGDERYQDGVQSLVENIRLRQFMALESIPTTVAFIANIVGNGKRALVGTHFKEEFDELKTALDAANIKSLYVNADPQKAFQKMDNFKIVDIFNSDPGYSVIFGNIETLGTAHNIPSADYCIVNSPDWANRNHTQIEGRAWRLNRKGTVYVVYPIFKDTIVEEVFNRAEGKKTNFNVLFD